MKKNARWPTNLAPPIKKIDSSARKATNAAQTETLTFGRVEIMRAGENGGPVKPANSVRQSRYRKNLDLTHHLPVAGVDDGAVDVELVDDVRGLVPPPLRHRFLGVNL